MELSLADLEQAINWWRSVHPSQGEERALSPEVDALATVYAEMIWQRSKVLSLDALQPEVRQLIEAWRTRRN